MKFWKKFLVGVVCGISLLVLAGCQQEAAQAPTQAPTSISDREDTAGKPFYVLLVGQDSRLGTYAIAQPDYADGAGRSDTMMLVRVDPSKYQITLVTVPRDTACEIDGDTTKINEAYRSGGIDSAVQEVEKLTGVSIKYHLETGFVGFHGLVDGLGGVTAEVPFAFALTDGVTGEAVSLSAGEQVLDGGQALALARMRKEYAYEQDASRQIQDRQIAQGMIEQTAGDPARVDGDVASLLAHTETNWPAEKLLEMAGRFAAHAGEIQILSGTGPYAGEIDESAGGQWLATRDEETWKKLIEVVDAGGDPTTVVPLPEVAPAQ